MKISILMAVYNGEAHLAEQIESILGQTEGDFELLIADDASSDGSGELLESYACRDHRIRLYRNEKTLGLIGNFESLLRRAQGKYLALSDQDDRWVPWKLRRQMEAIEAAEAEGERRVLVHSDLSLIDEEGEPIAPSYFARKGYRFPSERSVAVMLSRAGVMGNTILMHRSLLKEALPFPPGLGYHDYWLGVVAELFGRRITLDEPLVEYRIHRSNLSSRSRWLSGEMRLSWKHRWLPYRDEGRYRPLRSLLPKLAGEDRESLLRYLAYLRACKGWLRHYPGMRRVGFFRGDLGYELRILARIAVASLLGEGTR